MTERDRTTANDRTNATGPIGTRRATIASDVDSPETVAASIAPDDTDEIETRVEDGRVVTTIERETTGGLEATIDDYVVALDVATTTVEHARDVADGDAPADGDGDGVTGNQASNTDEQHTNRHDTTTQ